MENIHKYIFKSKEQRQQHLKLNEPCIERGGMSTYFKGLLAHTLNTTIPDGREIHVCHACHNAKCSNPNHLYWGTVTENNQDAYANGKRSIWKLMVDKYGEEEARRMQGADRRESQAKGGRAGKGKPKSEAHKQALREAAKRRWTERKENMSG